MKKLLKHLNNRLEEVIKERDYLKSKVTLKGSHSRYLSNNKRIVAYFRGEKLTIYLQSRVEFWNRKMI